MEHIQGVVFEYRCSRSSSLVDIGATVRRLANETEDQRIEDLIPLFLERLVGPRVCVFTILVHNLGQRFSLDNGMAIQELLLMWLKLFNTPRRSDSTQTPGDLRRTKQFCTVWWEARCVKIWTWPAEYKVGLIDMCHTLVAKALQPLPGMQCAAHGYQQQSFRVRPVFNNIQDICASCTCIMLEALRMDYKCIDIA